MSDKINKGLKLKTIILILIVSATLFGLNIGGVKMPDKITVADKELILNGAGVRERFFLDLYVGGLYLIKKNTDANKVMNADETMSIKLHIISTLITSKKMKNAVEEGFENSTNDNTSPLRKKIDRFIAVFKEEIKENDIYDITYIPEKGVEVYKNGKLNDTIEGLDFKKALWGIWFCDKPAQKSLKDNMLGKQVR
ncbi:MAG TPA: chalcone isomerase family protein [Clostridiales bacterium]|nr:chalcone isomerase family protein [Clostridiales bacterium]